MSRETQPSQESQEITPERELKFAMDAINKKNWDEAGQNLAEFNVGIAGRANELSDEVQQQLERIRSAFEAGENIPEKAKKEIEFQLQAAEEKKG